MHLFIILCIRFVEIRLAFFEILIYIERLSIFNYRVLTYLSLNFFLNVKFNKLISVELIPPSDWSFVPHPIDPPHRSFLKSVSFSSKIFDAFKFRLIVKALGRIRPSPSVP